MKCPFCNLSKVANRVIFETKNFTFFYDRNPVVQGHAILIPKNHIRRENEIPKEYEKEYIEANKKAYNHISDEYGNEPLTFTNAPQDQSVQHLHKHFVPGVFGPLGVIKALRESLK